MNLHPKKRTGALMRLYAALDALEMRIDSNINDVRRSQRDHLHGALENMRFELDKLGHQMNAASAVNATCELTSRHMQGQMELREAIQAAKRIRDGQPSTEALLADMACSLKDLARAAERQLDAAHRGGA